MRRTSFFFCFYKFQTISDKILWEFQKLCLKFPVSPYTMLPTYNTLWHNFCILFLNIIKSGKG